MVPSFSKIYLASGSPRRQELLTQLGVDYIQIENNFDDPGFIKIVSERFMDLAKVKFKRRVADQLDGYVGLEP